MFSSELSFWRDRLQASGIHLLLSLAVAALAAVLVFGIWYPYPYREISGGRELFLLVVSVDVILGPLITLAIFNRAKPWKVLRRDLAVVALLQLGALGYGLWTVFVARPVHMVFEKDRLRVVHAIEVPLNLLPKTAPNVTAMPILGPTRLSLRAFADNKERTEVMFAELEGLPWGVRPDFWQPYEADIPAILKAAKPVGGPNGLKTKFASRAADIDKVLVSTARPPATLLYLPVLSRSIAWTAFLDPVTADIVAYMPLDSF